MAAKSRPFGLTLPPSVVDRTPVIFEPGTELELEARRVPIDFAEETS